MWDNLTMAEKAKLIDVAVQNGIYNLKDIQSAYNTFAEGGSTESPGPGDGIDGIVSPSDINISNINKQSQSAVNVGKFANSYWGQRIVPVLDIINKVRYGQKISNRETAGYAALIGDGISTAAPGSGSIIALPFQLGDIYYDNKDFNNALKTKLIDLFTNNMYTWDDALETGSSVLADAIGFIPFAPTQGINTTDDFLQLSGNSLYRDIKDSYISPIFPLGHWMHPYQLGEAHVNTTKENVAKAKKEGAKRRAKEALKKSK